MYDRVSRNPGRVLITPEDGSGAFYATLALADNPTVVGTALNKANLLTDQTAAAFGLTSSATPNTVLAKARELITAAQNAAASANTNANGRLKAITGSYVGTGEYGDGGKTDPTIINLGVSPIVLFITPGKPGVSPIPWTNGSPGFAVEDGSSNSYETVTSTDPFTFYDNYAKIAYQLNVKGTTYYWMALYYG